MNRRTWLLLGSLALLPLACDSGGDSETTASTDTDPATDSTPGMDSDQEPDSETDGSPDSAESTDTDGGTDTDDGVDTDTDTDDGVTDTDTDTDTDGETSGVGEDPGCACIPVQDLERSPDAPADPTCGKQLCDTLLSESGSKDFSDLENPEALTCALTAVRDRTPGLIRWELERTFGQHTRNGYLLINEDGAAVWREYGYADLSFVVEDAILGELPAPEVIDDCLADESIANALDCLTARPEPQTAICDLGWWSKDHK